MKYTKKQLLKAYELWEKECRLKPEDFLTDCEKNKECYKEIARRNVETLISYIK